MSTVTDEKMPKTETLVSTESAKQAAATEPPSETAPEAKPRPERTATFQDYLVRRYRKTG